MITMPTGSRQSNLSPGNRILRELRAKRPGVAGLTASSFLRLSSQQFSRLVASPGNMILWALRARRAGVWFANDPPGGLGAGLPEVFRQDTSRMSTEELAEHGKQLTPEQRSMAIHKVLADRAAAKNVPKETGSRATVRAAYSPELEDQTDRQKQLNEADFAQRQNERQHLEGLFSGHFNTAIGKATTPSGKKAVIGDRPPRSFTNILASIIPQVYHEVAAARGIQAPYNTTRSHRDLMAIGAEMMNPGRTSFRLQHYDPHRPGPHRGQSYGHYFGAVAKKVAQDHFNNRLGQGIAQGSSAGSEQGG